MIERYALYPKCRPKVIKTSPAIKETYLIVLSFTNLFPQLSTMDSVKNHNNTPTMIVRLFNNATVLETS